MPSVIVSSLRRDAARGPGRHLDGARAARVHPAAAVTVGGGGSVRSDCLAVFQAPANVPATHPQNVRCTDGDPTCDADDVVSGVSEFRSPSARTALTRSATCKECDGYGIAHALDTYPELQALQSRIHDEVIRRPASAISAPARRASTWSSAAAAGVCKPTKAVVQMVTLSTLINGRIYRDVDRLRLRCDPAPQGCSPRSFFTGTFDRIQHQVFSQNCAVSGCHDSQSRTGNLLLEPGAAYTNLVTPDNPAAASAGWKRVHVLDATTGDPATSLLLQKLLGPPTASAPGCRSDDRSSTRP